jgi:hypothetical protein
MKDFIEEEIVPASSENADRSLKRPMHDMQKPPAEEEDEVEGQLVMAASPQLNQEQTAALAGVLKTIKRLNRNTTWVATGFLSCVLFAFLMLAVQEHEHPTDGLPPSQTTPAENAGWQSQSGNSPSKNTSVVAAEPVNIVYRALAATTNFRPDQNAEVISQAPVHREDLTQATALKVNKMRHRSIGRQRFVSVKMRLIALWHQSLARKSSTRSWAHFSNLDQGAKKKISFTRKADH